MRFRWSKQSDLHRLAADTNLSFDMLFCHVRNGMAMASTVEASRVQLLTGACVPIHHIVQMAREIVAVQNGVI